MSEYDLDRVDRQILHHLQGDARSVSTGDIGERVGVAASTVRTRINKMEETGVIRGYHPYVDYERAGYPLHFLFLCDAPPDERDAAERLLEEVTGVVRVGRLVGSEWNVSIEAIAENAEQLDAVHEAIEDRGIDVQRSEVYRSSHTRPFDGLGAEDERE